MTLFMPKIIKSELARAHRERLLVRFTRPFEGGTFCGYVLDVGPRFFLLLIVGDDGVRFNGFSCLRLTDVRKLNVPHKYANFLLAAQKKLKEKAPRKPPVAVGNVESLLISANRKFPLVTIHRETVDPEICHIGRVVGVKGNYVLLLEIGPDATWDKKPTSYRLAEITRVDFGGQYEEALHLVGGSPNMPAKGQ
jgi:hypothetical protein